MSDPARHLLINSQRNPSDAAVEEWSRASELLGSQFWCSPTRRARTRRRSDGPGRWPGSSIPSGWTDHSPGRATRGRPLPDAPCREANRHGRSGGLRRLPRADLAERSHPRLQPRPRSASTPGRPRWVRHERGAPTDRSTVSPAVAARHVWGLGGDRPAGRTWRHVRVSHGGGGRNYPLARPQADAAAAARGSVRVPARRSRPADRRAGRAEHWAYEQPLTIGGGTKYPDFTITTAVGIEVVREHLVMMGNPKYAADWEAKRAWYLANGFRPYDGPVRLIWPHRDGLVGPFKLTRPLRPTCRRQRTRRAHLDR